MQMKFIEKYMKFWWIFVSFRTFNWKGSWKMASFVSFLKAAFIPSVKAQEDIVNPQDALKVTTKSLNSPNWYLWTFSLFDQRFHLEVMSILYITFDINFSLPSQEQCAGKPKIAGLFDKFQTCNDRVNSRKKTEETCAEELFDYMDALNDCVAETLFAKLK